MGCCSGCTYSGFAPAVTTHWNWKSNSLEVNKVLKVQEIPPGSTEPPRLCWIQRCHHCWYLCEQGWGCATILVPGHCLDSQTFFPVKNQFCESNKHRGCTQWCTTDGFWGKPTHSQHLSVRKCYWASREWLGWINELSTSFGPHSQLWLKSSGGWSGSCRAKLREKGEGTASRAGQGLLQL